MARNMMGKTGARTLNMTEGPVTKQILLYAAPLLLGNLFQQVYNMVDTTVAGRVLGDSAIAAIGTTTVLYSLLLNITFGLNGGYGIILSQTFGAGQRDEFKKATATMLGLNLVISLLLTVVSLLGLRWALTLLKTPEEIFERAYSYIAIILAGTVATTLYNMCASYLRAIGNSRMPLYFLIFSSMSNLILDIFFVAVLKTDIWGAALATVIAQGISGLLCVRYILKEYRDYLPQREHFRMEKAMLGEMFSTGMAMALMQSVFALGTVILQRAINELGTTLITAHTAARRVFELLVLPMTTLATATATFVGQNYGARRFDRIRQAVFQTILVETGWSAFSVVVGWGLGGAIVKLLTGTTDPLVLENAILNIRISTICFFPLGVLFILRFSMQAMGHKVLPVLSSSIELGFKIYSAAILVPAWGYLGVAVTEPIIWILCAVFLTIFYTTIGHQKEAWAKKLAAIDDQNEEAIT